MALSEEAFTTAVMQSYHVHIACRRELDTKLGKCESEKIKAREAKQFTVQALRSAKTIELKNIQRGKYFRILADVYVDGKNLADGLIKSGHARAHDGGKRLGWCE